MQVTPEAVTFTLAELRALMAHASPDETRPHLCGVTIDAARSRAYATDGQRAVIVQARVDRVGPAVDPVVVPLERLDVARRTAKAGSTITVRRYAVAQGGERALAAGPRHVSLEVHDKLGLLVTAVHVDCGGADPVPIDAVLPPLSAVEGPRCPVTGMAPRFLADLVQVAKAADADGVEVWPAVDQLSPWGFTAVGRGGDAHWTVVIMPMRLDTDVQKAPAPPPVRSAAEQLPAGTAPAAAKGKGRRQRKAA